MTPDGLADFEAKTAELRPPCSASSDARSAAEQLGTGVSAPVFGIPAPREPKPLEYEDVSDNSIYRRAGRHRGDRRAG